MLAPPIDQGWAFSRPGSIPRSLLKLMCSDRQRMAGKMPVRGKEPEAFLLSLDEQQLGERVLVAERRLERPRGMEHCYRQKR